MRSERIQTTLLLLCCGILITLQRLHTFDEPLNWDLTSKAVIAHEMLNGSRLYVDIWDHKPPGIHVAYMLSEALAGYGAKSIFLLNIGIGFLNLLLIFLAAQRAANSLAAGAWAALLFAITSGNIDLELSQPNTEVFINASNLAIFLLLLRALDSKPEKLRALLIGVIIALGVCFKHIALLPSVAMVICYLSCVNCSWRERLTSAAMLGIGTFLPLGMLALYSLAIGSFSEAWVALIDYNIYYAGISATNLKHAFEPRFLFPKFAGVLAAFAIVSLAGAAQGIFLTPKRWKLWISYLVGAYLAIALPGNFFPHYYQLLLPPLVIGSAWSIVQFSANLNRGERPVLAGVLAVTLGLFTLLREIPSYRLSPEEWSTKIFGARFVVHKRAAEYLRPLLHAEDSIYVWGNATALYYYLKKRPISSNLHIWAIQNHSFLRAKMMETILSDLNRAYPKVFIVAVSALDSEHDANNPILLWAADNYALFQQSAFLLMYMRKDGQFRNEKRS